MKYKRGLTNIKRALSLLLSLVLTISGFSFNGIDIINSFAYVPHSGAADGSGNTSSSITGVSGNGSFNSNMIGYRFTLVDKEGNVVSLLDGKPSSVDISWFDLDKLRLETKYYFTNSKLEEVSTVLGSLGTHAKNNKVVDIKDISSSLYHQIAEYFSDVGNVRNSYVRQLFNAKRTLMTLTDEELKQAENLINSYTDDQLKILAKSLKLNLSERGDMIKWLSILDSKHYIGQGEAFKNWMLGKRVDGVISDDSNIGSGHKEPSDAIPNNGSSSGGSNGSNGGKVNNSQSNNANNNSSKPSKPLETRPGNAGTKPSNTTSTQLKSATKAESKAELSYFKSSCDYKKSTMTRLADSKTAAEYNLELSRWRQERLRAVDSYYASGKIGYNDSVAAKQSINDTHVYLVNYGNTRRQISLSKNEVHEEKWSVTALLKEAFGPITAYAGPANPDEVIKELENEFVGDEAFGKFLINTRVKNDKFVFELEKVNDGTYESPLKACMGEEYILLVEPLYAFIPRDTLSKRNFSSYVIGTATSYSQGMCLLRENGLWSWNSGSSDVNSRVSNRTAPRAMYTPEEFPNEDIGYMDTVFKVVVPEEQNLPGWVSEGSDAAIPFENMVASNKLNDNTYVGYGLHIYVFGKGNSSSKVHTWDSMNYPTSAGPSEDPISRPVETEYGKNSKNIKIVKYYQTRWQFEQGEFVEPTDYFVVTGNPHTISIDDEAKGPGYKLKDYFTSKTDWTPPEGGNPSDYSYDSAKKQYKNGKYSGQTPTTLKINTDDTDIVLHVLLEWEPEFDKKIDVVKIYDTDGVTDNVVIEKDVAVVDNYEAEESDNGYMFKEATSNSVSLDGELSGWADVPQDNYTTSNIITVGNETVVVYLHYIRQNIDVSGVKKTIVLAENEITHPFVLNDLTGDGSLRSLSRTFKAIASKSCPYERWSSKRDKYITCRADLTRAYTDDNYVHTVSNHEVYEKGFVYQTIETNGTNSGNASSVSGFVGSEFNPNMNFVINRSYTDKVTLYPGKNGNVSQLQDIGTLGESYLPQGQRYNSKKESDRIQWYNTFKTNYQYDTVKEPEGEWEDDGHGYGSSWPKQTSYETSGKTVSDLNEAYSISNNVNILAFLGKAGKGTVVPDTSPKAFEFGGKAFKTNLNVKQSADSNIQFYPSIMMKMQTLGGSETNVFVTSENLSELLDVRRAEAGVYKTSAKPALELSSYQWSSHFKSLDMLKNKGINDTKAVLPGGAAYELKTSDRGEASEVWIGFKTYTTCVEDATAGKLADTSNVLKLSTVQADNETFKNTVRNNLEHFQIVQEVVSGVHMDNSDFDSHSPMKVSGPGQVNQFGGNTLDRSSKYYLKTDGRSADRADLDILNEVGKQIIWKITADENGNITVYKDGNKVNSINKIQGEGIFLADQELKDLNDKTKVITNFVKSLDRNKGSDRNRDKWYNEGFDSILVVENGFSFKVGFGGDNPIRGSVLDTKLCGRLDSRSDLYNFEEPDKIRTSVFRTSDRSTTAEAGKAPGYVGTINGLDVSIPNMKYLFTSKFFIIPNATVTDLN